jgi:hypothetical protein
MYIYGNCNTERLKPLFMALLLPICTAGHQTLFGFCLIRQCTETTQPVWRLRPHFCSSYH